MSKVPSGPESRFTYRLVDGHVVADVGGSPLLVDTGSPSSFGEHSVIQIGDRAFDVRRSYLGLDAVRLSKYVGTRLDGLLGVDVLSQYDVLIDPTDSEIRLNSETTEPAGTPVEVDFFMDIPIVAVCLQGKRLRMFLDTGAKLSYLNPDILTAYSTHGEVRDFYPGVGSFDTKTHLVPLEICDRKVSIECGVLPTLLQMTLMAAETDGILGTAVLSAFSVQVSWKRQAVALGWRG